MSSERRDRRANGLEVVEHSRYANEGSGGRSSGDRGSNSSGGRLFKLLIGLISINRSE
jgi:hypothetical protein